MIKIEVGKTYEGIENGHRFKVLSLVNKEDRIFEIKDLYGKQKTRYHSGVFLEHLKIKEVSEEERI